MSWQHMPYALDDLLAPIPGPEPCGANLRHEPVLDRLREMRREDDPSLPEGVWQAAHKQGDWAGVEALAGELLCSRSKDLMLAVWLGEAWLMRFGFEGATPAIGLLVGLCERYPDALYPRAEDGDRSWRASPLEWMVRRYTELLLTRCPLLGKVDGDLAGLTLSYWQQLKQRQVQASDSKADKVAAEAARLEQRKLDEALKHQPSSVFASLAQEMESALAELARLEAWCEGWLEDAAPSVTPLRQPLEAVRALMQEHLPMQTEIPPMPAPSPEKEEAVPSTTPLAPIGTGVPNNRQEAYRQLALIADYLAGTEPHSPVPYVIRRAVEWGHQPLSSLLDELINADGEARRVWQLLGVLK